MSLRSRFGLAAFFTLATFFFAIVIWAQSSGNLKIFGDTVIQQATINITSQSDWKTGAGDAGIDLDSNPGTLQLKQKNGWDDAKWTKIDASGGPADKLLFAGDTDGPFSKLIGSTQGNAFGANDTVGMFGSAFAYDAKEDKFLLFGLSAEGAQAGGPGADQRHIYSFDPKTNTWEKWATATDTMFTQSNFPRSVLFYYPNTQKTYLLPSAKRADQAYNEGIKYFEVDWQAKKLITKSSTLTAIDVNSGRAFTPGQAFDTSQNVFYAVESDFSGQTSSPFPVPGQQDVDCSTDTCYFTHKIWKVDPVAGTREKIFDPAGDAGGYSKINQKDYSIAGNVKIDPVPIGDGVMTFDSDKNQIIYYGGAELKSIVTQPSPGKQNFTYTAKTWVFDLSSKKWREIDFDGPKARNNAQLVYDSSTKSAVLFGGQDNNGVVFSDSWAYSTEDEKWTKLAPSATGLAPRTQNLMVYDSSRKCVVTFGGRQSLNYKNDEGDEVMQGDLWKICAVTYPTSGMYVINVGGTEVTGFNSFEPSEQVTPSGTSITYQFKGSADGVTYSTESTATAATGPIVLTNLVPAGSKFLQVRINLTSTDGTATPSLGDFHVNYSFGIAGQPTPTDTSTSPTPSASATPGQPSPPASASVSPSPTPTKIGTVTTSKSTVSKLVSTGQYLWVNLLIAAILSGIFSYIVMRQKPNK